MWSAIERAEQIIKDGSLHPNKKAVEIRMSKLHMNKLQLVRRWCLGFRQDGYQLTPVSWPMIAYHMKMKFHTGKVCEGIIGSIQHGFRKLTSNEQYSEWKTSYLMYLRKHEHGKTL